MTKKQKNRFMYEPYHYLRPRIAALLWPAGLIYAAIVIIRVLSFLPFAVISVWYWSITGLIILLFRFGSWIELENKTLTHYAFFIRRFSVPIQDIIRIAKGPPYGLAQTDCIYYYYLGSNGKEKYVIIVLFNHDLREVNKFITDLTKLNSKIEVDENIIKFFSEKKK